MKKEPVWEKWKATRKQVTDGEEDLLDFVLWEAEQHYAGACADHELSFKRQAQDKIEQLSVELTAERSRRIAAEAEVERLKRGVADVLSRFNPPAETVERSPRSARPKSRK